MSAPGNGGPSDWLALASGLGRVALNAILTTLPIGLLSLGLALVIWVTVTNEENPSLRRVIPTEIPIEQVNVPKNLLTTNVAPQKVTVTVTGPRNTVTDLRPEDVTARVDLSRTDDELAGVREGEVERPVRVEVKGRGVRAEASPEFARVRLEQQERRNVPVCVSRVDVPPPGFAVEDPITADPAEVAITGSRRNIDAVECAAAVLRLTGLTVNVTQQVTLEPRDAAGRAIGGLTLQPNTTTLNVKIKQSLFPRQAVIELRTIGRPAAGYAITGIRADPTAANVVGPLDVINALNAVPTEEIDIEGARGDVVRSVSLQLPQGVSSGERRTLVTISIQAMRGPGSIGATPRIVNLGAGLTATPTTPAVAVLVSGPLPDVLALRPADVSVTVDAANLGPGVHRLEPKVTLPNGINLDGVLPDRVEITIR